MKPRVVVAPDFRTITEVFDPPTLARLDDLADVVWGRDGPMSQEEFVAALADATAVIFGTRLTGFWRTMAQHAALMSARTGLVATRFWSHDWGE